MERHACDCVVHSATRDATRADDARSCDDDDDDDDDDVDDDDFDDDDVDDDALDLVSTVAPGGQRDRRPRSVARRARDGWEELRIRRAVRRGQSERAGTVRTQGVRGVLRRRDALREPREGAGEADGVHRRRERGASHVSSNAALDDEVLS